MSASPKHPYHSPRLQRFGTIPELTAAIGGGNLTDQSDFPIMFPPDKGSFDVCRNTDPTGRC